ncbi:hypothetical protein UlMin_028511 [Ulmus minor]
MEILNKMRIFIMFLIFIIIIRKRLRRNKQLSENSLTRHYIQELNYHRMIHESDLACIENTHMDIRTFSIFCQHLRTFGGLKGTKNIDVEEMVVIFLHIISHDVKNRIMRCQFTRSGESASDSIRLLVDCFKFEADATTRRMKEFDELKMIEGFTAVQRLKVGQLVVHDQANVDYFFTLDEEIKLDFLLQLLDYI